MVMMMMMGTRTMDACEGCGLDVDAARDRFCRHCGRRLCRPVASSSGCAAAARAPRLEEAGHGSRRRSSATLRWTFVASCVFALFASASFASAQVGGGGDGDEVSGVERRIAIERERQARIALEDAYDLESSPKEIHVHCPQDYEVEVFDLPDYAVEHHNQCLVFHVSAPGLDARLVVRCDGEFDGASSFYAE